MYKEVQENIPAQTSMGKFKIIRNYWELSITFNGEENIICSGEIKELFKNNILFESKSLFLINQEKLEKYIKNNMNKGE
jgi:hypothetical protein